ncbi:MAG: hypothetical protein AB1640_16020 [bacterium]
MAGDAIQFYKIEGSDSELVAVAEVPLFRGVYLRGWYIFNRRGRIEVVPPHKVYREPADGDEKTWSLLRFDNKETERRWLEKVEEEYRRWDRQNELPGLGTPDLSEGS